MKNNYIVQGVPISDTNISYFINEILENFDRINNVCVSLTGAHGIINSRKDKEFYKVLNSFDYNLPDGQPSVWIAKLKGAKNIQRCFGPFVFAKMMEDTSNLEINHYFCGGKEGVAENLVINCKQKFNNNNIVGTYSPPFRDLAENDIKNMAEDINAKKTDILWIGISTPKQEILANRLSKYTNVKCIITVGAAFDYYTESIKIAPSWIQSAGLEWFFRLILEPNRLWERYFNIVPRFLFYGTLDILGLYKHPFERIK